MNEQKVREILVEAGKEMLSKGLTCGTAGNISMRIDNNCFAITPTSMNYNIITPEDIVICDYEDNIISGKCKPSVEISMHRSILVKRSDVNAVIHTHPLYGTAVCSSQNFTELPPIDLEMVSYLGGAIKAADFAPAGSKELAHYAVTKIEHKAGVLLKNHGAIGVGKSMEDAFTACEILERACYMYFLTQLLGGPVQMPVDFVHGKGLQKYYSKAGIVNLGA